MVATVPAPIPPPALAGNINVADGPSELLQALRQMYRDSSHQAHLYRATVR